MTSDEHGHTETEETFEEVGQLTVAPTSGSTADALPLLGRIEHFTLLERIGMGGMGELFLAHDERLGRKVALKLVRAGRGSSLADTRLLREAQTLARISHPNVVTVFEAGIVEAGCSWRWSTCVVGL